MIYFDHLPLSKDILEALAELEIDYVFQPIFYPDGKTVYAREALMRPHNKSVTDLIAEYQENGKLHVLEVATFFGASQAYQLRGYSKIVSVNSFPSEVFTQDELKAYTDYFGNEKHIMIWETLEYPYLDADIAMKKRKVADVYYNQIALDDFGAGISDEKAVDTVKPDIVKLDRGLITDIDKDENRQQDIKEKIDQFHARNINVIAEGIETEAEFETMKRLGADFFQGYYLGMPR